MVVLCTKYKPWQTYLHCNIIVQRLDKQIKAYPSDLMPADFRVV